MRLPQREAGALRRGFTIIELLTAMTVLAFLVVMAAQILSMSTKATTMSGNQLNNLEKSRRVFDRIGMDLASAISPRDIPFQIDKSGSSDSFQFYSQKSGFDAAQRGVSFINYRINNDKAATPFAWERGLVGVDNPPFGGAPVGATTFKYQPIAEGILRFKISFLSANTGTITSTLPVAPAKISAIIVTLVVVDDNSLKLFDSTKLENLANKFSGTISGPMTVTNNYYTQWSATLKGLGSTNVEPRLIQATRVYQTYYEVR